MNTREIRQLFTRFFEERGHRRVPSSSLIPPPEERTMLFTTAGMVQMKPYFMNLAEPVAKRLTTTQKCFRTTDIEEVGDNRHCTFFEMLGNFSVGDYFKAEVIPWAWELLTAPQPNGLGLNKQRIWATIFEEDEEAHDIWRSVGVPEERIVRYGEKENYWFMGRVGPCGPNTEINYDFGPYEGWEEHACHPNCDKPGCRRFIELWNLVFMTLYQDEDGSRRPLPQRNVDTGAGLDRWVMPLLWEAGTDWQGNRREWKQPPTIFDNDIFQPILAKVGELSGLTYYRTSDEAQRAMRVVAEHVRAATFLLADGVGLGTEGRGDVLRRLIRRAVVAMQDAMLFGGRTPTDLPPMASAAQVSPFIAEHLRRHEERWARWESGSAFLALVADEVISLFGREYEEVRSQQQRITRLIHQQDASSRASLREGLNFLNEITAVRMHVQDVISLYEPDVEAIRSALESEFVGDTISHTVREHTLVPLLSSFRDHIDASLPTSVLTGDETFLLAATYGLDLELVEKRAAERGFTVDRQSHEALEEAHRAASRAATRFEGDAERIQTYVELGLPASDFQGYETTRTLSAISAIILDGTMVVRELSPAVAAGRRVEIVLDHTPFYPEGGGQVGDRGEIVWPAGQFIVEDTQAVGEGGVIAHIGRLEAGALTAGDFVEARVDEDLRADTMRNHTATHLLHAALRNVLGPHARQAGSLVTPDRLRFDFTHLEALSHDELRRVEALANKAVRENLSVSVEHQSYEDAVAGGALAFFGEKYAAEVRVIGVCDLEEQRCFSKELCGGTHVHSSGDIGAIVVTGETSIGAGLRRIEAVTGRAAAERIRQQEDTLAALSAALNAPVGEIETRIAALREENDRLRKQLQATERRLARSEVEAVDAETVGDTSVVVRRMDAPSGDALREAGDAIKATFPGKTVVLLGAVIDGKPSFVAMSTPDVARRVSAGDVVRVAAKEAGGGGGGRPESAQGGGVDPSKLDAALAAGRKLIEEKLTAG